jgi:hypothetical protein
MELEIINIIYYGFITTVILLFIYVTAFVIIFREFAKEHSRHNENTL